MDARLTVDELVISLCEIKEGRANMEVVIYLGQDELEIVSVEPDFSCRNAVAIVVE